MAHHWDEEPNEKESITPMTIAQDLKKIRNKERALRRIELETLKNGGIPVGQLDVVEESASSSESSNNDEYKSGKPLKMVREHINMCKSKMRNDPRPIDATCGCYTCKGFSRAYLHHLFKAKETLGGTLITIHNVYFMNRLMREIREGIANDTLEDVERAFVHPNLVASVEGNDDIGVSDGIGN